jgi:MscS family membrane protein
MDFLRDHLQFVEIAGILTLTLILVLVEKAIFHSIYPKAQKSVRIWDDSLVYAVHMPLKTFIWLTGFILTIPILESSLTQNVYLSSFLANFYKLATFSLLVWASWRCIAKFESKFSDFSSAKYDPTTVQGVTQVLKVFILSIGVIGTLQFLGIPLSGVIAFGGIGGIAVGFAAKDLLANFFGGIMIFLDRPFQIGDWVRSPDKEIEGTIEHIGWRLTRIRTFDQRPLFVPNSIFSTISLENPSRMTNRRIKANLNLSYEDAPKIAAVLSAIENMLKTHPEIDTKKVCFVNLVNFGDHALEVQIYTFTKTKKWLEFQAIQQDVFLKILEITNAHGCKVAYPTRSIRVSNSAKEEEETLALQEE